MKRTISLRIDQLRLDRAATGLAAQFGSDLEQAVRTAAIARCTGTAPNWPVTTRPALRRAAETLAARVPVPGPKGAS